MRSRNRSLSPRTAAGGAAKDLRIETGSPASLPGVYTAKSAASRSRRIRWPLCPHSASPFVQSAACCAAYASTVSPFRRASSSLTHGAKSAGARSGKVSRRFATSPLGSMMRAGMPSRSASSRRLRQSPVLPLPVMPTHTA